MESLNIIDDQLDILQNNLLINPIDLGLNLVLVSICTSFSYR